MYHSKILNRIKLDYFFKFPVHELNSKMINFGTVMLIERENASVPDIDVTVSWKLQSAAETVVDERKRESWRDIVKSVRRYLKLA
jgi:hypothetical protein